MYWSSGDFYIGTQAGGSGTTGFNHLNLKTAAGKQIRFHGGSYSSQIWSFDGSAHFLPGNDNSYDIGSGSVRPRDIYVGGKLKFGSTSTQTQLKSVSSEMQIGLANDSATAPLVFRLPVAVKTSDYSIVESDTDRCLTNTGASGAVKFTLPSAVTGIAGVHLYFSVETAQSLVIAPASADTIRIGATATATGKVRAIVNREHWTPDA